jgi:hypothetical protein
MKKAEKETGREWGGMEESGGEQKNILAII